MIFLRPYFLLLLIVLILFWIKSKKAGAQNSWAAVCDPHLLPYLTIDVNGQHKKFYSRLMLVLWCCAAIALAGPATLQDNTSTVSAQSGLVAVVDMSPVSDEKTIQKIIHKLYDIADHKKDTSVGVVLTDKKAYTAMPLTQDADILKSIASQLKEKNIMPSIGQNIPAGINTATQLLQQSGFKKGQILVLFAGTDDTDALASAVQKTPYPVFFIGIADNMQKKPVLLSDGSFWNQGKLYGLTDMPQAFSDHFLMASIDETDLNNILEKQQLEMLENQSISAKTYTDFGFWIMVLMTPFIILLFRKGVLFILCLAFISGNADAAMWQRTEQQDYKTHMNAINAFNAKDYEQALQGFSALADFDTEALYNMGNTLAYMGNIEQAIQTYERVLQQNPNHQDAAFNLEYLKKQIQQQKQEQQNQQNSEQQKDSSENKNSENNENQQQDQSQQNEQQEKTQKQDNTQENTEQDQQQTEDGKKTEQNEQKQKDNQSELNEQEQKQDQKLSQEQENKASENKQQIVRIQPFIPAKEQKQKEVLDKINSDAGRVLRYRLNQQYGAQK